MFHPIDEVIVFAHLQACLQLLKEKSGEAAKQNEKDLKKIFKWIAKNQKYPKFPCVMIETLKTDGKGKLVEMDKINSESFTIQGYSYPLKNIREDFKEFTRPLLPYFKEKTISGSTLLTFWQEKTKAFCPFQLDDARLKMLLEIFSNFQVKNVNAGDLPAGCLLPTANGMLVGKERVQIIEKKEHIALMDKESNLIVLHEDFVKYAGGLGLNTIQIQRKLSKESEKSMKVTPLMEEMQSRLTSPELHTVLLMMDHSLNQEKLQILGWIFLYECDSLTVEIGIMKQAIELLKFKKEVKDPQPGNPDKMKYLFIFQTGTFKSNSLAGLLIKTMEIKLDKDSLVPLLESGPEELLAFAEGKLKRKITLTSMEPGRSILPIHEHLLKGDVYAQFDDDEVVVVDHLSNMIYGKICSHYSGVAGTSSCYYKVDIGEPTPVPFPILYIYKLRNENEQREEEEKDSIIDDHLAIIVREAKKEEGEGRE